MDKSKTIGIPEDSDIIIKTIETIKSVLDALKEDSAIMDTLSKSQKERLDILYNIAINDKLPEEDRSRAFNKFLETIDVGNQSTIDFNDRENRKSKTLNTVIISTTIFLGIGLSYKFNVNIITYERLKNIGNMTTRIAKNISNILV
ncbi:MAG: hypothetical protein WBJ13_10370 [Sedimentibacter sp.]